MVDLTGYETVPILPILLDTEGAAATDDLTNITGGTANQIVILRSAANARVITVVRGSSVIAMDGAADFVLNNVRDRLMLIHNGSFWVELSRSNNA